MIKALLIITALGGADYRVEMPTIEQCLEARKVIASQDMAIRTLCVPKESDTVKIEKFLSMFSNMVKEMKKIE